MTVLLDGLKLKPFTDRNLAQILYVTQRGRTEQTTVLATKLRRTLVTNLECGCRCIQAFRQHELSCFIQAHPFLELKRAHGRH